MANLNVDRQFIPAIEAALFQTMHAVVLQNTALAGEIFQTLTENKSGQAALAIPEWSANLHSIAKSTEGALAGRSKGRFAGCPGANRSETFA